MIIRFALAYIVEAQRVLERRRALHRLCAFVLNLIRGDQASLAVRIQHRSYRASALHIVRADHTLNVRALLIFRARSLVSCEYNYVRGKIQRENLSLSRLRRTVNGVRMLDVIRKMREIKYC